MSRTTEITMYIILLQAAIGFVDASGMFQNHYLDVVSNNASYNISDLDAYASQTEKTSGLVDQVELYAHWAWDAFFIGLKIMLSVVFIFPTLVNTFGVPIILATFLQVGVYYVYATWYSQYKSGKGWKYYE